MMMKTDERTDGRTADGLFLNEQTLVAEIVVVIF